MLFYVIIIVLTQIFQIENNHDLLINHDVFISIGKSNCCSNIKKEIMYLFEYQFHID